MFDRIDLHVDVPAVDPLDLSAPSAAEPARAVARRVVAARELQQARFNGRGVACNAEADGETLEAIAAPDAEGRALLTQAAEK